MEDVKTKHRTVPTFTAALMRLMLPTRWSVVEPLDEMVRALGSVRRQVKHRRTGVRNNRSTSA
jgi:hypothetical protein